MVRRRRSQSSTNSRHEDAARPPRARQQQRSVSRDHRRRDSQSGSDVESGAEKTSKAKCVLPLYSMIVLRLLQKNTVHTSRGEDANHWPGFWHLPRDVALVQSHYRQGPRSKRHRSLCTLRSVRAPHSVAMFRLIMHKT